MTDAIRRITHLLFADDLVLFSDTVIGLQRKLNKLAEYCEKWGLSINDSKTKCMIVTSGKSKGNEVLFHVNNEILENVCTFKYLGIIMNQNGKFKSAIEDRISKANRAVYMIKQAISCQGNISCNLAMTLFDRQTNTSLWEYNLGATKVH